MSPNADAVGLVRSDDGIAEVDENPAPIDENENAESPPTIDENAGEGPVAFADSPGGSINIIRDSISPQPSGSDFDYLITFACSGSESVSCEDVEIRIPLDPDTTPSMIPAGLPAAERWAYEVFGSPQLGAVTTTTQGNEQVIHIENNLETGSSHTVRFRVRPPNGFTADGQTWTLRPTLYSSSFEEPFTSQTTADGEATATATIQTAKALTTGAQTVVQPGQKLTYRLTATCNPHVWIELGHLYLQSARIVDTLPDGLTIVDDESTPGYDYNSLLREVSWEMPTRADLPVTCGGPYNDGGGIAGDRHFYLTVQVNEDVTDGQALNNIVTHSGLPIGESSEISETRNLELTARLAPEPWPGGTTWVSKSLLGTIAPGATYAGNWITPISAAPRDDTHSVEAVFDVTVNYDSLGFRTRVIDPLPCLDEETSPGVYGSTFTGACANPAFHLTVLGIVDWTNHTSNDYQNAYDQGWRPQVLLTDGTTFDLDSFTLGPFSNWVNGASFPVPESLIGQVAGVIIEPDDAISGSSLQLRLNGYADSSLQPEDRLVNTAEVTPYRPNGTEASDPVLVSRDLNIIAPTFQLGITKAAAAAQVAPSAATQFTLQAQANSPYPIPGPIVIADLLPTGYSFRGTPGTTNIAATRNGTAASGHTAWVEVVDDYQSTGRQLVRATISPTDGDDFAGGYWNFIWGVPVTSPEIAGSAVNAAQIFLPQGTISTQCYRGLPSTDNALDLDGSGDLQAQHCEASTTVRVVSEGAPSYAVTKTVQGDLDPAPRSYPHVGVTRAEDGSVEYVLTWTNTGGGTLTDIVVYDVLPHIGDNAVLNPIPRDSAFRPILESIDPPSTGVELSYSTSDHPCQPEITSIPGCESGTWSTSLPAGGISEVRALRLAADGSYDSGESFSLSFRMSVPDLDPSTQIAWNNTTSHAWYSAGTGPISLEPTESPIVGLQGSSPSIAISKTDQDGNQGDDPDNPVDLPVGQGTELHFTITNDGNNPLRDIEVSDRIVAGGAEVTNLRCDFTGDGEFNDGTTWPGPLAVGGSVSCRADLGVLELNELHGNIARVEAIGTLLDEPVEDEDPFYGISQGEAGISLVKRIFAEDANTPPGPFIAVGTEAEWFYEVTLAEGADLPLDAVRVIDDNGTPDDPGDDWEAVYVEGDTNENGLLDVGETWLFATPPDQRLTVTAGEYANEATASGEWAPGQVVFATDPAHYFGAAPAISIEKLINGQAQHTPPGIEVPSGAEMRFDFIVVNTGNVTLTGVRVTDDQVPHGSIVCAKGVGNEIGLMEPGEEVRCTASLRETESDSARQHVNVATVTGVGPDTIGPNGTQLPGTVVEDSSTAYAHVLPRAAHVLPQTIARTGGELAPLRWALIIGGLLTILGITLLASRRLSTSHNRGPQEDPYSR